MITTKKELRLFLEKDKQALGRKKKWPSIFDDIWIFEIALRHHEYHKNIYLYRGGYIDGLNLFFGNSFIIIMELD